MAAVIMSAVVYHLAISILIIFVNISKRVGQPSVEPHVFVLHGDINAVGLAVFNHEVSPQYFRSAVRVVVIGIELVTVHIRKLNKIFKISLDIKHEVVSDVELCT